MSSVGKVRRLLHLLERLQSGRIYNAKELADFCEVSRRTTFRDIKVLQESGVPIEFDSEREGYRLVTGQFLPPTNFTLEETLSLLALAQDQRTDDRELPFLGASRDAALKLQSNLPGELRHYVGEYTDAIRIKTEPLAELAHGKVHYERVLEAITDKRKIRLHYDSFYDKKQIVTLVSPYRLLFERHTWYVIGRSSLHRAVRMFHVGRIEQSELTNDSFTVPPRFNLNRFFGNAWRMVRMRGERETVTVRFQPKVARNVAEVNWHKTQATTWNDDGTLDFTVVVDGIDEISWWIMGYGAQAEVLQPQSLRDLIRNHLEQMTAVYKPDTAPRRKRK